MIQQVILGDCLIEMQKIPDKTIDLILTDLPYGTTACSWDIIIPFDKLWQQYERIRKENCVVALFGSEPFLSYLRMSNIKNFRYDWIWHKSKPSGIALVKKQPMRNHEIISIFYNGKFNAILEEREGFTDQSIQRLKTAETIKYKNYTSEHNALQETEFKNINKLRNPTSIKKFASIPNRLGTLHPTQKPVELLEYLIKTYTNELDLVLDNCAGSGSSLIAAKNLNRQFIGIEKEEKYYNVILERLSKT